MLKLTAKLSAKRALPILHVEALRPLQSQFTLITAIKPSILLRIDHLSQEVNNSYSERLNKYYKACGCTEGSIAGLIAMLIAGISILIDHYFFHSLTIFQTILFNLLLIISFMIMGKKIGLLKARNRFSQVIQELIELDQLKSKS